MLPWVAIHFNLGLHGCLDTLFGYPPDVMEFFCVQRHPARSRTKWDFCPERAFSTPALSKPRKYCKPPFAFFLIIPHFCLFSHAHVLRANPQSQSLPGSSFSKRSICEVCRPHPFLQGRLNLLSRSFVSYAGFSANFPFSPPPHHLFYKAD